jgi:hypothetical protein
MDAQHSELLHEIHRELKTLTQKVESAFVKDDDGMPDFTGHRSFHKRVSTEEQLFKQNRSKVFRDIATWAIIGIITIIGSSLFNTYILHASAIK